MNIMIERFLKGSVNGCALVSSNERNHKAPRGGFHWNPPYLAMIYLFIFVFQNTSDSLICAIVIEIPKWFYLFFSHRFIQTSSLLEPDQLLYSIESIINMLGGQVFDHVVFVSQGFFRKRKTSNLETYVNWFNRLSYLVATEICMVRSLFTCDDFTEEVPRFWESLWVKLCVLTFQPVKKKQRARIIEFFIDVAQECYNIGNFNSLMAIISEYLAPLGIISIILSTNEAPYMITVLARI